MIDYKSKGSIYEFLRWAEVTRVDYVKCTCDIKYLDAQSWGVEVPYVSPHQGLNYFMGGMPDVGSIAIVGYYKLAKTYNTTTGQAIILGFLPRYLFFAADMDIINVRSEAETNLDTILQLERMKTWKLYPGEFLISSKQGSDIRIDKSIFLQNGAMNEIKMDAFSQVMSFLALNQKMNSAAGSLNFGLIHRNDLLFDDEYSDQFSAGTTQALSDGREFFRVTNTEKTMDQPCGFQNLADPGVSAYTEFRIEIQELSDDVLDVTEESSGVNQAPTITSSGSDDDSDVIYPVVTFTLGTLVGNDALTKAGKESYGKVLTPVTFQTDLDTVPLGIDVVSENKDGIDGEGTQAACAQLKLPNTQTSWSLTKEGVLEYTLDQSSGAHPLGAGRSANIGLLGSLKAAIGRQALDGKSLLLDLLGGALINIGGEMTKGRSLDMQLSNGLNIEINGSDQDRNSVRARIHNNIDMIVEGSRYTEIRGDEITLVHGLHETRVLGKKQDNYINDKANNYGGSLKENVIGSYQSNVGQGRAITIASPGLGITADSNMILIGNKTLEMALGEYSITMAAGAISETLALGDRSCTMALGDYSVDVAAGEIDIETQAGACTFGTAAGLTTITGLAGVTVEGAVISLNAAKVTIGALAGNPGTGGGVVNNNISVGHKDYIVGIPLHGSVSVTCNGI